MSSNANDDVLYDDVLYTMLHKVVKKRKRYPAILMKTESDRLAAEIQNLNQIKVELEDNEEPQRVAIAAKDTRRLIAKVEPPVDTKLVEQEFSRKQIMSAEIDLFAKLRSEWARKANGDSHKTL